MNEQSDVTAFQDGFDTSLLVLVFVVLVCGIVDDC